MFDIFALFYLLLVELPIVCSINIEQSPLTVIGDKNVTRKSNLITKSFSKLSINGPFYCYVTWIDNEQTVDIYTDNNIHPYVIVHIEKDTLKIAIQSDGNFKFTDMNVYLHIHPTIDDIFLAGISTLYSTNVMKTDNLLKLHTQDTSSLILQLDIFNIDALFLSAGTTKLMGHVKDKGIIKYDGIGNVDASQLFCKFIDIEANGLGTIWITGTDQSYSINNFMNLTVGLFIWSLTLGFNLDLEYRLVPYCKIRRYFTHVNYLLSSVLLTMASINRYARVRQAQLTENRHRYITLCERRTTYIIIIVTIIFCLLVNIHIPILFEIADNDCYARMGIYRILFDVYFLVFYAICPPLLMVIFNIATVKHIRCIKKLIHPTVSRREYHFIVLVIAHSFSNVIFTIPYTVNKFIYYTFDDAIPSEKDKLCNAITLLIAFMNPGFSFYLYTLTTKSFRDEF
ncbi:unnamed protein product [Rotaria sp. Silwood2]|nr:unnamed protein product [Rotaria sp. Silwood2]